MPYTQLFGTFSIGDLLTLIFVPLIVYLKKIKIFIPISAKVVFLIGIISFLSLLNSHIYLGISPLSIKNIFYCFRFFYFSFLIIAVASLTRDSESNQNAIINGIIISTLISLLISWFIWMKSPNFSSFSVPILHITSENITTINRNYLGFILSPGLGIVFTKMILDKKKYMKILYLILFLFFSISSLLTFSKGAWLSIFTPLLAVFIIFLTDTKFSFLKKMIIGILCTITTFFIIQISSLVLNNNLFLSIQERLGSNYNSVRLGYVLEAIRLSLEHPFLGIGPQGYQAIKYLPVDPHNAILGISSEMGIIAATLMIFILFINFKSIILIKNINKSDKWFVLFFLYLSLIVHMPLQGLPIALKYLWILFGLVHSVRYSKYTLNK